MLAHIYVVSNKFADYSNGIKHAINRYESVKEIRILGVHKNLKKLVKSSVLLLKFWIKLKKKINHNFPYFPD